MINFSCMREQLKISGKIFGDIGQKRTVVILSHGFLANQKMCKKYAKLLAEAGFIAVTFDFCGGGLGCKSEGKSENMTLFTEKADLLAVIDFIKQQPYTENIVLLGCSQGGLVSAMVAKELGTEIEKLILLYPALCIPDDARAGKMMFYEFDPNNIPDILGNFPMKLGGDYARCVIEMDPFMQIGGFDGPVLYLHGTADDIVDISYARKAKELYPNCEYHEIQDGGHAFRGKQDKEACKLLINFMRRNERGVPTGKTGTA